MTATVDNKSLICASVVSKKIASGATSIVLDVKYGSGAFIKTPQEAKELGDLMIKTGKLLNRKIDVVISSMEQPLGTGIGNSLEVIEAIEFLKGRYEDDLYEITFELAYKTLLNCNLVKDKNTAKEMFDKAIEGGFALNKLREIIIAQKGVDKVIDDYGLLKRAKNKIEIKADKKGYITSMPALSIAHCAKLLGAGRDKKTDLIDHGAGIVLKKKITDEVNQYDTVMELYWNDVPQNRLREAIEEAKKSFQIQDTNIAKKELIFKTL